MGPVESRGQVAKSLINFINQSCGLKLEKKTT